MKDLNYYWGLNYTVEVEKDEAEGGFCFVDPGIERMHYLCRYHWRRSSYDR